MLTPEEFEKWCSDRNLPELSLKTLAYIRSVEPARRVGGGRKNVSGFYPSKKIKKTIQFESHKVELPFIYELEHDEDVLEYYDQPPAFKINYQSNSGRNLGFFYTPDFFVIRKNSAGWVECKTEKELQKLLVKQPHRYSKGEDGCWLSPPANDYAAQFGFDFQIKSDAQINWVLYRNITFLEDYYRWDGNATNNWSTHKESIGNLVRFQPGITLSQLLDNNLGVSVDSIYFLIASEQIYVDLGTYLLVEPEQCKVFYDRECANAYQSTFSSPISANTISYPVINLVPNTQINWDGQSYTLIQIGQAEITLRADSGEFIDLPLAEFESKIRDKQIIVYPLQLSSNSNEQVNSILTKASKKDLEDANHRYRSIEPILLGQTIKNPTVSERTLRDWIAKYRQAQQQYGYGYIGLLNCANKKGNRNRKLPQQTLELIDTFITQNYETYKQKRKLEVYGAFCNACSLAGIVDNQIPSYKTFINEIKRRSGWEQTLKREGHRAAYPQKSFYWELELTTPRHGDRPFEIGHIDHTKLDIELRCSHTGQVLGRPWATFLVDSYSRRILAVYLTFDPPSYRSCMMVLRVCVMRHSRLPQIIVTDNGKEFHSTYFESLLALFECTLKHRPPAASRFSGVCERLFGTANTQFLYNLAGNTQITKKVRLMTKSVNPKNLAVWTLGLLYLYFCEWAYSEYDTTEHPALGMSPDQAFTLGIAQYGSRTHRLIPDDENWRILTLPTTQSGRVKVHPTKGIQIRGIHYWNSIFRDPEIHKISVEIRYDPFDVGIAYAYVRGQWVKCISEYYAIFKGRSEKEILLATAELQKRNSNHHKSFQVRAKKLAEFLSTAEAEEALLAQRLRDTQGREVFTVFDGFVKKTSYSSQFNPQENFRVSSNEEGLESLTLEENLFPQIESLQVFESY
ncbi:MAG: DDE-type integrase/transposase/recombinase [Stigonema ocellatum SAG 48.90 = DSM 106950]|nr:DDE-type integrase/transposase/recombinase [Stigonema ocellatum SAG 48.90 = DSM 106950]